MIAAYPLAWPDGWKRTPTHERERAQFGQRKTLTQWSVDLGISRDALEHRLNRGWDAVKALTTPVQKRRSAEGA